MAKKITDLINYIAASASLPDGALKDRVYDTDGETILQEGSRIIATYIQDVLNPFHRLGRNLGKYLNGVADTQTTSQFYDWLIAGMAQVGSLFGSATRSSATYNVTLPFGSPLKYTDGLTVSFSVPSTYSSTTVYINLNGIGQKQVSETELASGESPTVSTDLFSIGKIVTVVYRIRTSDAYGYWQIKRISQDMLAGGKMLVNRLTGDILDTIERDWDEDTLTKTEYYPSTTTIKKRWESSLFRGILYSYFEDKSTSDYNVVQLDAENGDVYAGGTSSTGFLESRFKRFGLNFSGGPHSADTAAVYPRFTRINIPVDTIEFIADSVHAGNWRGTVFGSGGSVDYTLSDVTPENCEILGMGVAYYTTFDGTVKAAPLLLEAADLGDRFNGDYHVVVMSGDSAIPGKRPYNHGGNEFIILSLWYDGAQLA